MSNLPDRWLAVDPGEDTGWSIWSGRSFVDGGTTKLWEFSHDLWEGEFGKLQLIVCEDWRLYPWYLKSGAMDWDECRTARLIGSITAYAHKHAIELIFQPAKIKERALAAGAEAVFDHPLHENRHTNDSRMHGIFYIAKQAAEPWANLT